MSGSGTYSPVNNFKKCALNIKLLLWKGLVMALVEVLIHHGILIQYYLKRERY